MVEMVGENLGNSGKKEESQGRVREFERLSQVLPFLTFSLMISVSAECHLRSHKKVI